MRLLKSVVLKRDSKNKQDTCLHYTNVDALLKSGDGKWWTNKEEVKKIRYLKKIKT